MMCIFYVQTTIFLSYSGRNGWMVRNVLHYASSLYDILCIIALRYTLHHRSSIHYASSLYDVAVCRPFCTSSHCYSYLYRLIRKSVVIHAHHRSWHYIYICVCFFFFRSLLPQGVEMVVPGDNATLDISLIYPVPMAEGLRFALREGGKTVGAGVVAKLIE